MTSDLVLVPRPQQITVGETGPSLSAPIRELSTEDIGTQGYEIDIADTDVILRYGDDAGRRYGCTLLEQIRAQVNGNWPQLTVKDWPDYPVRGYMLDVSRGRVPTRDTLDRIVGILEVVRINHLQLYTEHTFAYADHEVVWQDASPLTPDDIRWLDARCQAAGIELAANQNCFGHMENWLAHPEYLHRAEMPEGMELFGQHRAATTLAPTQDNADFALGLLDELLPNFQSLRVNIGCDETWELGQGVSAADAEARGKGRIYLEHIRRLLDPLIERGYQPQFWGDIIAHYPKLVTELPDGATAVAWIYEAPREPSRTVIEAFRDGGAEPDLEFGGFAARSAPFIEAGYSYWVAPGTSTWRSLIGRLDNAKGNLVDAAEIGRSSGASGYLITDWGDLGHLQPPSVSFPPLVYGAAVSWSLAANRALEINRVLDRFVFNDSSSELSSALETLGLAWGRTGQEAVNCSPLLASLVGPNMVFGAPDADQIASLISDLDKAMTAIGASVPNVPDGAVIKEELIAATRLARHGGYRLLRDAKGTALTTAELRADLADAMRAHREAWLERSRPGGMEIGLNDLAAATAEYEESAS